MRMRSAEAEKQDALDVATRQLVRRSVRLSGAIPQFGTLDCPNACRDCWQVLGTSHETRSTAGPEEDGHHEESPLPDKSAGLARNTSAPHVERLTAMPMPADMCYAPERSSQEALLRKGAVSVCPFHPARKGRPHAILTQAACSCFCWWLDRVHFWVA